MSARSAADLYEDDFDAWTQLQAKELRRFARTRPNLPLDLPHIADEIADLGQTLRASMRSWARHIIEHLLLLEYSPAQEPRRGWIAEIVNLRSEIEDRLTPVLHRGLRRRLPLLYDRARRDLGKKLAPCGEAHIAARFPARPGARRLLAGTQRLGFVQISPSGFLVVWLRATFASCRGACRRKRPLIR